MKSLVFVLLLVVTTSAESSLHQRKLKISDKHLLERQRDILRLLRHINQPSYDQDHAEIAASYSVAKNADAYLNSSAVEHFLEAQKQGLLPRGETFSVLRDAHLDQAVALFKLFYYARDFETLYKTAAWARNNVNEGLFLYAFSTALKHRRDTYFFVLPPIHEINPYYFFSSEVIQKAQEYKQLHRRGQFTIYSNHSGYPDLPYSEQALTYFREDAGMNAFYYYCNVYYPFWMDGEEFKLKNDRRGEQFYYLYQQFLARFYLERLSHDLGDIEALDYEALEYGYHPSLRYPNGLGFPQRPGQVKSSQGLRGRVYDDVKDYERRIRDGVDAGFVLGKGGDRIDLLASNEIDVLGNLVEGNSESPNSRFYGQIQVSARRLLGHSPGKAPSALEHFETAHRDPAFYRLYKRILAPLLRYKALLPPYTRDDLYTPGVRIESVDFHGLVTYFDHFESEISNAVYVAEGEADSFEVRVLQKRLNHKPFTYKLAVNSGDVADVVVRVYLGPKFDEHGRVMPLDESRHYFVEVDTFPYKLEAGKNVIARDSRELYWFVPDRTTHRELYKKVSRAIDGDELQLDSTEAFYGLPNRLLLPRGKLEGQTFQVYVIINPYRAPPGQKDVKQEFYFHKVGTGMNYVDDYAFGFPFDRRIGHGDLEVPNSKFQDVVVYHSSNDLGAQYEP